MNSRAAILREALDALSAAEFDLRKRCLKDQPHDHETLRKLRATIPRVDAAYREALRDESKT